MEHTSTIIKSDEHGIDLLTLNEVSKILRCSNAFLYQLRKANKLQAIKGGKKVLFKVSALQDYLSKNMEGRCNGK